MQEHKEFTVDENPFNNQDEVFFISYDEIIRSPYPFILHKLNTTSLGASLSDYLDLDKIKPFNFNNLLAYTFQREHVNVLEDFKKTEFDVNTTLAQLKERYVELYQQSPLLSIGKSMFMFLKEEFIKKIYIYSETYDERIAYDIFRTYGASDKLQYAYGPLEEVIPQLAERPTSYFFSNIDDLFTFADKPEWYEYCQFFMADYRFNYVDTEDSVDLDLRFDLGELFGESPICKFAAFMPVHLEAIHVDQFAVLMGITDEEETVVEP